MKITLSVYLMWVLIFGTVHSAGAEEQITGAFGIKLGQIFNPDTTKEIVPCDNGHCSFTPEKKFRSFDRYSINRTIKTHEVYEISTFADMYLQFACEKEQDLIMAALKKKYGDEKVLARDYIYLTPRIINQGHRYILTSCLTLVGRLVIKYVDRQLEAIGIAEKESKNAEEQRKIMEEIMEEMDAADI